MFSATICNPIVLCTAHSTAFNDILHLQWLPNPIVPPTWLLMSYVPGRVKPGHLIRESSQILVSGHGRPTPLIYEGHVSLLERLNRRHSHAVNHAHGTTKRGPQGSVYCGCSGGWQPAGGVRPCCVTKKKVHTRCFHSICNDVARPDNKQAAFCRRIYIILGKCSPAPFVTALTSPVTTEKASGSYPPRVVFGMARSLALSGDAEMKLSYL